MIEGMDLTTASKKQIGHMRGTGIGLVSQHPVGAGV